MCIQFSQVCYLKAMFKYREEGGMARDDEILRCYHMSFAITKKQIRNRRDQLGLNEDKILHKSEPLNFSIHISILASFLAFDTFFSMHIGNFDILFTIYFEHTTILSKSFSIKI